MPLRNIGKMTKLSTCGKKTTAGRKFQKIPTKKHLTRSHVKKSNFQKFTSI